jgi:methionyl-tRNA synthetase
MDAQRLSDSRLTDATRGVVQSAFNKSRAFLDKCEFRNYLDAMLKLSGYANKYIDQEKIWILKKEDTAKFQEVMKQLYSIIVSLGILSGPLFPDSSKKIFELLGIDYTPFWPKTSKEAEYADALVREVNTNIKPTPLFKKIEMKR